MDQLRGVRGGYAERDVKVSTDRRRGSASNYARAPVMIPEGIMAGPESLVSCAGRKNECAPVQVGGSG